MLSRKDLIRAMTEEITVHYFVNMLNPKRRPTGFKFDNVDIGWHVLNYIDFPMAFAKKLTKAEKETAKGYARLKWKLLLEDSDVQNWSHKQ